MQSVFADLKPRQSRNMTRSEMDKSIGEMTRRALDWMQQDTEKQAKENKAMQELLHGVICIINDVVADLALPSDDGLSGILTGAGSACRHISEFKHRKELSIDNVDKLVSEWENALLEWRKRAMDAKNEAREALELFGEDCDVRMQRLCEVYEQERGAIDNSMLALRSRYSESIRISSSDIAYPCSCADEEDCRPDHAHKATTK